MFSSSQVTIDQLQKMHTAALITLIAGIILIVAAAALFIIFYRKTLTEGLSNRLKHLKKNKDTEEIDEDIYDTETIEDGDRFDDPMYETIQYISDDDDPEGGTEEL